MTAIGTIRQVRRYPVKSMEGEVLEEVEVGDGGIPGDRAWAVRDEVRGGIRGAKKIAKLMELSARYVEPPPTKGSSPAQITLQDGTTLETGSTDVNEHLSRAVGQEVSLWPLVDAEQLDHYRRGAPTHEDMETELREMFGRAPDEPLPNLGLFPPELMEFESPPGTYFDAFPLLLMSDAALASMGEKAPGSVFDVRRFRPNFVISNTEPGVDFPEFAWEKRRLKMGEAILSVEIVCPRCVMTTHGFGDLPKDPGVMRALVREAGGNLGVYASIEQAGRVRTGDSVELLA